MKNTLVWGFAVWAVALANISGVQSCGYYEEGSSQALTCSTGTQEFTKYGPRIEIDETFQEFSYCDSNGNCQDNDASRFSATFAVNQDQTRKNVTLHIKEVTRNMTKALCYIDGRPLHNAVCDMNVYVIPNKPTCTGPEFIGSGSAAVLTCTSDRVYPDYPEAVCGIQIKAGKGDFEENHRMSVQDTVTSSDQYPGDFELTCRFTLDLSGIAEDRYSLGVVFHPRIPDPPTSTYRTEESIPPLDLRATALFNPGDSNSQVAFDPATGDLTLSIDVISNPPPYVFSLSVWAEGASPDSSVPVSKVHYSVSYRSSTSDDLRGTIEFHLATTGSRDGERISHFKLSALNRVVGDTEFEYLFTTQRHDIPLEPATCAAPEFVDDGATALFSCAADRVFPSGSCQFSSIGDGTSPATEPVITTSNDNSAAYPGDKTVKCELRLPVAGNRAGDYQFQVEITPTEMVGNLSTYATTSTLSLKPTMLYDEEETNHVFSYPDSGELNLDVHVTGSPRPNRITLWARHGETSKRVPVSSRDFRWTYVPTVGSESGVIQLTVSGGLEPGGVSSFTVKAENGVTSEREFEYKFTVEDDSLGAPNPQADKEDGGSGDNLPIIVGAAVGGVVVIALVVILVVVLMRRNSATPPTPEPPFEISSGYIYPNMEYHQYEESPKYSELPPYEAPRATGPGEESPYNRPFSTTSVPEYCEVYDCPPPPIAKD